MGDAPDGVEDSHRHGRGPAVTDPFARYKQPRYWIIVALSTVITVIVLTLVR